MITPSTFTMIFQIGPRIGIVDVFFVSTTKDKKSKIYLRIREQDHNRPWPMDCIAGCAMPPTMNLWYTHTFWLLQWRIESKSVYICSEHRYKARYTSGIHESNPPWVSKSYARPPDVYSLFVTHPIVPLRYHYASGVFCASASFIKIWCLFKRLRYCSSICW